MTTSTNTVCAKFQSAKIGDLFYTSLTDKESIPKLLKFAGIKGKRAIFDVAVAQPGDQKQVTVDAADPEGKIPKLTNPVIDVLASRVGNIQNELVRYLAITTQIGSIDPERKDLLELLDTTTVSDGLEKFFKTAPRAVKRKVKVAQAA